MERKHQETVDRLNSEVTRLKTELEYFRRPGDQENIPMPKQVKSESITTTQFAVLQSVEKAGGVALEPFLIQMSDKPKLKTQFDIGELERRGFLDKNYDQSEGEYTYEFTHEGRRAYLEQLARDA